VASILFGSASATIVHFGAELSGFVPTIGFFSGSPGIATLQIDYDAPWTLRFRGSYTNLHGPPVMAQLGNGGPMTRLLPIGFPAGTSGTFDFTLDLSLASSYDATFLAFYGTVSQARFVLLADYLFLGTSVFKLASALFIAAGEIAGIVTAGCVSACEDPHFMGLNGYKYDFQGAPNTTFALVSDPTVQLNCHFDRQVFADNVTRHHTYTNLGDTCIRSCDETIVLHPNGDMIINGRRRTSNHVVTPQFEVFDNNGTIAMVVTEHWWFVVDMLGDHLNINQVIPVGKHTKGKTHGVLGHTLDAKPLRNEKCSTAEEGGCEVAGSFHDYIIHGDLCSITWKYEQFSEQACKI